MKQWIDHKVLPKLHLYLDDYPASQPQFATGTEIGYADRFYAPITIFRSRRIRCMLRHLKTLTIWLNDGRSRRAETKVWITPFNEFKELKVLELHWVNEIRGWLESDTWPELVNCFLELDKVYASPPFIPTTSTSFTTAPIQTVAADANSSEESETGSYSYTLDEPSKAKSEPNTGFLPQSIYVRCVYSITCVIKTSFNQNKF